MPRESSSGSAFVTGFSSRLRTMPERARQEGGRSLCFSLWPKEFRWRSSGSLRDGCCGLRGQCRRLPHFGHCSNGHISTPGFAWLLLGNADDRLAVLAAFGAHALGSTGLSFVLALMGAAAIVKRQFAWLAVLLIPVLLPALPAVGPTHQTALVVQPNIPEEEQWTEGSVQRLDQRLSELSTPQSPVDFVVWPEVPAPIYDTDLGLPKIAIQAHAAFLAGVVSRAKDDAPLNSALLLSSEGKVISRYDKVNSGSLRGVCSVAA